MDKSELKKVSINELLPQQPPFVMVDELLYFDKIKTITKFLIKSDNIFIENGELSACGIIENIAQTCAVRMGYINYLNADNIKLGFIGAIKGLNINRLPKVDEIIETTIEVREEVFSMTLVDAKVICNDEVLACGEMKIALSDIDSEKKTNLFASKEFEVRFSEVDSMNIVWHGSYPLYFEDAREEFGAKYGIDYLTIFKNGYYAPLVDLSFSYKKPLVYGSTPRIDIFYRPTDAAKIIFDYEIRDTKDNSLIAIGHSIQVFLDKQYQLVWTNPPFYEEWKKKWLNI